MGIVLSILFIILLLAAFGGVIDAIFSVPGLIILGIAALYFLTR